MKTKLTELWHSIKSSYWFVPTVMAVGAILLSFVTVAIDRAIGSREINALGWLYTGGPEGARTLLLAISGSMLGVTGVVFSLIIVVLSLTSSQFGPRLLRNFISSTGTQIVLGTFISAFIYCLLVVRTIRSVEESPFVPHLSVTFATVFGIASIGVLIYIINHMSSSIQVVNIIASVAKDLDSGINHLFPEDIGHDEPEQRPWWRTGGDIPSNFDLQSFPVVALASGYLLAIDNEGLVGIAARKDIMMCLKKRPGDFITQGSDLLFVWPGEKVERELVRAINAAFILGVQRTKTQDILAVVEQLVEIAIRALSPGINDPLTAVMCIDRLGAGLCQLAERSAPSPYRYDGEGKVRVIAMPVTFEEILDTSFSQIRQYGRTSAAVTLRLLETIAVIATRARNEESRAALLRHAMMILRGSKEALPEELDRMDVEQRYQAVVNTLMKRQKFS